jgi:hypothetical protein
VKIIQVKYKPLRYVCDVCGNIIFPEEISLHSFSIADLLKRGDYVNGQYVFDVFNSNVGKKIKVYCMRGYLYENEIMEVVTKEQFDFIKYEVCKNE